MNKVTCASRIKEALAIRNMRQADLCQTTGIPKSAMSQYISGAFEPKQDRVSSISKALNVSEAWLMGYDVPMQREDYSPTEKTNLDPVPQNKVRMIPVFNSVSAGFGAYASNEIVDYAPIYIESDSEANDTICINVTGDSMYPKIENGDTIVIHKQTSVDSGSIAVVLVDKEEGLVKKVTYGPDWIELHSINPMYQPQRFEGSEVTRIQVVGLVKKVIKNLQ